MKRKPLGALQYTLNVFLVLFVALIDEWQPRNIKEWKGGRGSTETKKTRHTSKVTINVEQQSALSLLGRGDQEEFECERRGTAECFGAAF